jgi:hypothetical protein
VNSAVNVILRVVHEGMIEAFRTETVVRAMLVRIDVRSRLHVFLNDRLGVFLAMPSE